MIIVDTSIISELTKPSPNQGVIDWLDTQEPTNLYLTSITATELTYGAYCKPRGRMASALQDAISNILEVQFKGRILPFDVTAAYFYGLNMTDCRRNGISVGLADAQIASIAIANSRADIASRDVEPFEAFRLRVINPFLD